MDGATSRREMGDLGTGMPTAQRNDRIGPNWIPEQLTRTPWPALAAAVAVSVATILWLNRGITFSFDELTWVLDSPDFSLRDALEPYNGHLVFTSRALYEIFFNIFGSSYLPFRFLAAASVATLGTLFFIYTRPLVGSVAALAPTVVLLFFGSDPVHVLAGNAFTVLLALSCGLGALIALRRDNRAGELVACALLSLGVVTYTVALAFVIGVAIPILLRGDRWRRTWIVAVPFLIYAIWWLWSLSLRGNSGEEVLISNLAVLPAWVVQSLSAMMSALTGFDYRFPSATTPSHNVGSLLAVVGIAALVWRLLRRRIDGDLWGAIGIFLGLATLTVLVTNAFRGPDSDRYLLPGSLVVLMIAAQAVAPIRLRRDGLIAVYVFAAIAVGANLLSLREASHNLRAGAGIERAELAAIDIAGPLTPDDLNPSTIRPNSALVLPWATDILDVPPTIAYREAAEKYGTFGFSVAELRSQSELSRVEADRFLIGVLRLTAVPATSSVANCKHIRSDNTGMIHTTLEPGQSQVIEPDAAADLVVRRFATSTDTPFGQLAAGSPVTLSVPRDGAPDPWQFSFSAGSARVCDAT